MNHASLCRLVSLSAIRGASFLLPRIEAVGWYTLAGATLVLCGTALSTGFAPGALCARQRRMAP